MRISQIMLMGASVLTIGLSFGGETHAQNTSLTQNEIEFFYQDFADAKVAGGEDMIGAYRANYDENTHVILRISNVFPPDEEGEEEDGNENDESIMEHDFDGMMKEAEQFSLMLDYKAVKHEVTNIDLNEDGRGTTVHYTRLSDFLMKRYGIKEPFKVKEISICEDDLKLFDGTVKIIKSDCKVKLYIDRRA